MDEDLASVVPVSDEANSSRSSEASVFAHSRRMLLTGDSPQAKKADCRPSASPTTHPWIRTAEQEVPFDFAPVTVAGVVRQLSAKVTFDLSRTSSERYTGMRLRVVRADVGVRPCCTRTCFAAGNESCGKSCTIVLIYKVDIRVTPKFGAEKCQRLEVSPDHKPQEFTFERNSNRGCLIPLHSLWQTAVTFGSGTTVGRWDLAHRWGPSSRVDASKEAFFHWKIRFYDDGSKFEFNRLRFGTRPPLPINPSDTQISPREAVVEAFWSLKPELEKRPVEFVVSVTLYTAVSKRLFPFYNVTMGPSRTFTRLVKFTD